MYISEHVVEVLLTFGCFHYHKGREVVFLDHHSLVRLDRSGEWRRQDCQLLVATIWCCKGG